MHTQDEPTSQALARVVTTLAKLRPGFLPFPLFQEFARLMVLPIVELVPLRKSMNGDIEILLLPRDDTDPIWPDQLHVPGTVVRATDNTVAECLNRLVLGELIDGSYSIPTFATNILHDSGRGKESSQVYWVEVTKEPTIGSFYPYRNLPSRVVQSQLDFLSLAVEHYEKHIRLS
jgi:hypothetical protein